MFCSLVLLCVLCVVLKSILYVSFFNAVEYVLFISVVVYVFLL